MTYRVEVDDPDSSDQCCPNTIEKTLLNNVSGICKSGEVSAIMGASGAGKTTLLNSLACRLPEKNISGKISANEHQYSFETFGNFANYVMQQDSLMHTLTVRETLQFAADLRYSEDKD